MRKSKAAGYDFIKVTTFIKPEVYEAAVDEAAKQNIRVVGHADSRFVGVERLESETQPDRTSMVTWNSCFVTTP